jgi:uncharacterized protein (TIGR03067 family)
MIPMRSIWAALVVFVPASGFAAPVPKSKVKPFAERMIGEWKVESRISNGQQSPPENGIWTIAESGEFTTQRDDVRFNWTYKLDATQSPVHISIANSSVTYLGIIEVDGDTMRLCYSLGGEKRPGNFSGEVGTTAITLTRKLK